MNDASTVDRLQPAHDMRAARALLARELGADRLAALHETNKALDIAFVFGSIALFALLANRLASLPAGGLAWWLCLALQGNLIVAMSIVNHDMFVHRKLLPMRLRWVLSQVLTWPAQLRGSIFESRHLTHHRELATAGDPEFYSRGLDTAVRRVLYATPLMLVFRAVIYREQDTPAKDRPAHGGEPRLRWEKATRLALWGIALVSLAWDWRLLVFGYLAPLALVTPVVNSLRIVLEHFDMGRGNPLWPGTCYRTGAVTRAMFLWSAGDCHVVHHFYPSIPIYRMPAALRLMRPILLREGVHEHRSLGPILTDWFSGARAHWTRPGAATAGNGAAASGATP
jgi:fatty acid desaturase